MIEDASEGSTSENASEDCQSGTQHTFQVGNLFKLKFKYRRKLQADDETRAAYEVFFQWENTAQCRAFRPGEAIGIVCPNVEEEIDRALILLHMNGSELIKISALNSDDARKRFERQFRHIPTVCSVRHLLSHVLDLRTVVKRVFLKILGDCCPENSFDRQCLHELSATPSEYREKILEDRMMLLDILEAFPHCRPTLSIVIENLSRLAPRFYSIANYDCREIRIIYRPVKFKSKGKALFGLCSSFFEAMDRSYISVHRFSLDADEKPTRPTFGIECFLRKNTRNFEFPPQTTPFIYIGHGTGVAPIEAQLDYLKRTSSTVSEIERWILYGCRYLDKDLLLSVEKAEELNFRVILKQSRAEPNRGYVQTAIQCFAKDIVRLIDAHCGEILICGDYNTMTAETLNELKKVFTDEDGNERVSKL